MKHKIFAILFAILTIQLTTTVCAQEQTSVSDNSSEVAIDSTARKEITPNDDISTMIEQIVEEQAQTESREELNKIQEKYDVLKKEFEHLKEISDKKDKEFNQYIDEVEKRLSEQQMLYDKALSDYENKTEQIYENSKHEVRDKVQDVKEKVNFFMVMMIVIFSLIILVVILIGVFMFFYGKNSAEKAIRKAIEAQTGAEIKRYLSEIKLEERLQHKGDHAINRLFTELGDKSRDTIKKLDSIQSEYELTLDSLKTKFKETTALSIKQQFGEFEIKSKDKLKSLNNVQSEYEKTLAKLKDKINEISKHLAEKGDLDLQVLLKELETKSEDKISKLDNIQCEYENTLDSLKNKILEIEDKISVEGAEKVQELISDLNDKSQEIVNRLNEIQSEYEATLNSLEDKISETQKQLTVKGDAALKEFLVALELKSEEKIQELDSIQDEHVVKLDTLHAEYETSLNSLNNKVGELAQEVSEKGNEIVKQLLTELEKSSLKVKELDTIQIQYDQTLDDLKNKLKDVENEVNKKSDEQIKTIFNDIETKSDLKVQELDNIKTVYESALQSLKEQFRKAEQTFADKDVESMCTLFEELMVRSEEQISNLIEIKREYETGLETLKAEIDETRKLLQEKGENAIDKLFTELEVKSETKIEKLDDIHSEFEETLDSLKERVKHTEQRIENESDAALEKLSQKLENRSSEEIFKLNKLQNEYLNALNFLNEKIESREEMQVRHDALPNELDNEVVRLIGKTKQLVEINSLNEALETINKAIAISPSSIDSLYTRADIYKKQEKDSLAIEDLTKIVNTDENNINALIGRALLYKKLHDNNNALTDLNTLVKLEPNNPSHFCERGIIFGRLNLDDEAIKDFTKSISLNPDASGPYFFRALIYKKLGETAKAIEDISKTIECDPNEAYLYKNRAQLYSRLSQYDKAIDDYSKAIKLDSSDFSNCVNLTKCYMLNNNFTMAKDNLDKYSNNAPKIQDKIMCAFYNAILVELNGEDTQKALEAFTQLIETSDITMRCYLDDIMNWIETSDKLNIGTQSFILARVDQLKSLR